MASSEQKIIRQILLAEFQKRRRKNPAYSQRAFAQKLGLNSGSLSSIMKGKRDLSPEATQALLKRLKLEESFQSWILEILEKKKNTGKIEIERALLEIDRFEIISSPLYLNALNLLRTSKSEGNLGWLGNKLKITPGEASAVAERLERAGLLKIEGQKLIPTKSPVKTPETAPHHAIRAFHKHTLQEACGALEAVPLELRDFSSLTIPANPEKMAEVRELIQKFRDEVSFLLGSTPSSEVYKLSVQFYPVAWQGGEA